MIGKFIKDPSIKKGIISSLIATIFFIYLLSPLLNLLSKGFIILSTYFSSAFIDGLYREMAKGKIDYSFLLIFAFFILTFVFHFLVGLNIMFGFGKKLKEHIRNRKLRVNSDPGSEKRKFRVSKFKWLIGPILTAFGLWTLFVVIMANIKVNTIVNFEQRLNILKPYINNEKEEILKSEFALMSNRNDFYELYQQMDSIASKNGIKLPEVEYSNLY